MALPSANPMPPSILFRIYFLRVNLAPQVVRSH
jgi:hypothetical protein